MEKIIVTVIVLASVISLYFISYVMNRRTPLPEGVTPIEECDACNTTSCSHHPENIADEMKQYYEEQKEKPECEI